MRSGTTERQRIASILATWPAEEYARAGGFILRRGGAGGKRTAAATSEAETTSRDVVAAEAAMRAWGQRPLFMVPAGETALDGELDARGYEVCDRSLVFETATATLAGADPERAFFGDALLRVLEEIWGRDNGPARVAVMARTPLPKVYLLGRHADRVAGAGFAAIHGAAMVLHALEVAPAARRKGVAAAMVRAAAAWGCEVGATRLRLAVARSNAGAIALYRGLGFEEAAAYHYRRAPVA